MEGINSTYSNWTNGAEYIDGKSLNDILQEMNEKLDAIPKLEFDCAVVTKNTLSSWVRSGRLELRYDPPGPSIDRLGFGLFSSLPVFAVDSESDVPSEVSSLRELGRKPWFVGADSIDLLGRIKP